MTDTPRLNLPYPISSDPADVPADILALATAIDNLPFILGHAECIATADVTLATPGSTFNGISPTSGDVILLTSQVTGSQNGPWVFNGAASPLTRPSWFGTGDTHDGGLTIAVDRGTLGNAESVWMLVTDGTITVDTTAQSWKRIAATNSRGNQVAPSGLQLGSFQSFSGAGTISESGSSLVLWFGGSSNTVDLPTLVSGSTDGLIYFVTNIATTSTVTLDANAQTFNVGGSSLPNTIDLKPGEGVILIAAGTQWRLLRCGARNSAGGLRERNAPQWGEQQVFSASGSIVTNASMMVEYTGSTAAQTLTLPEIVGTDDDGWQFVIFNNATVDVTLDGFGAETIDGGANIVIPADTSLMVFSTGPSSWATVGFGTLRADLVANITAQWTFTGNVRCYRQSFSASGSITSTGASLVRATSAGIVLTLPTVVADMDYTIHNDSVGAITVNTAGGGDTIGGTYTSLTIGSGESVRLHGYATNLWGVLEAGNAVYESGSSIGLRKVAWGQTVQATQQFSASGTIAYEAGQHVLITGGTAGQTLSIPTAGQGHGFWIYNHGTEVWAVTADVGEQLNGVAGGTINIDAGDALYIRSPITGRWKADIWRNNGSTLIETFTASGVWAKPVGAKLVQIELYGAGGGGGSGRKGAAATSRNGGGGGGAGGYIICERAASGLPATLTVTIGAGGTGGASQTVNSTNGIGGSAGGDTGVSGSGNITAQGGNAGGGGGVGGTSNGGYRGRGFGSSGPDISSEANSNSIPAARGFGGGANGDTTMNNGGSSYMHGGGGGCGGGISAAGAGLTKGNGGGADNVIFSSPPAVASGNGNNAAGAPGWGGGGGAGGAAATSGNATAGGNGGLYGAGGGGGGASVDSSGNSGAGGNGSQGLCIITTHFA